MFDLRLGLALGKSLGEVHTLPVTEYRQWQLFYLIEPWGWNNTEYLAGAVMSMLYNVNRSKKTRAKKPADFMRDMIKSIFREFRKHEQPDFDMDTDDGRRSASEYVENNFKAMFGMK